MGMNFTDSNNWSKGSETKALDIFRFVIPVSL